MKLKNIIKNFIKDKNIVYVIDFDHTITTFNSSTSIGVYSQYLGKEYKIKKDKIDNLVNKYKGKLITKYLWIKKIKLLNKYYNKELLGEISKNFEIRKEFKEFIEYLNKNNIDFIICSSGHKELIELILKNNGIFDYKLLANRINTPICDIITPYNKNKFLKRYTNKKQTIIIGDHIGDSSMVKNSKISIGIANKTNKEELKKYFDYVVIGDECYEKKY